jgi:hypothetical protein
VKRFAAFALDANVVDFCVFADVNLRHGIRQ